MAIEGLDAGALIESAGFVPHTVISETPGPTLDAALAQAGQAAQAEDPAPIDREARPEAAAPDLWVTDAAGYRPDLPVIHPGPLAGMLMAAADAAADAANDPLILHKLTIDDLTRANGTGRYGDSTEDYAWWELATGDFEWAKHCFMMDVYSGVNNAIQGATSQTQADQQARDYIHSFGLDSLVHVNNREGGDIVITGSTFHLLPWNVVCPLLTVDPATLANLQFDTLGPSLDRDNCEIHVDSDVAMTDDN